MALVQRLRHFVGQRGTDPVVKDVGLGVFQLLDRRVDHYIHEALQLREFLQVSLLPGQVGLGQGVLVLRGCSGNARRQDDQGR